VTHPGGRPTKYKPEYCEKLIEHMAEGLSFETFAATIGVSRAVLYNWCDAHSEFLDAKNIGKEKSQLMWEHVNIAQATGAIKGSSANTIFTMKCRFGWKEAESEEKDIKVSLSYSLDDPDDK